MRLLHGIDLAQMAQYGGWWYPATTRARTIHYYPDLVADVPDNLRYDNEAGRRAGVPSIIRNRYTRPSVSLCNREQDYNFYHPSVYYTYYHMCQSCLRLARRLGISDQRPEYPR